MTYTVSEKAYPIRLGVTDKTESVLQGIALILGTRKGSVPLYRDFGIPWDFLDRTVPDGKTLMFAKVREAIMEYVPEAELIGLNFADDPDDPGHTYPVAEVTIGNEKYGT